MFEICEVEATFHPNGLPKPTCLVWKGEKFVVLGYGRHWQTDDGWHLLINVANGRVFELLYNGSLWRGRSANHPAQDRQFFM